MLRPALFVAVLLALTEGRATAAENCAAAIEPTCLSLFGAGDPSNGDARCAVQIETYRGCLERVAGRNAGPSLELEAEARAAYDAEKDRGDPEAFDLVAERFAESFWGALAARDAAELRARGVSDGAATQARRDIDAQPMAAAMQKELRRIGDYSGPLDGQWGASSQAAFERFQQREAAALVAAPSSAALALLKKASKPDARRHPWPDQAQIACRVAYKNLFTFAGKSLPRAAVLRYRIDGDVMRPLDKQALPLTYRRGAFRGAMRRVLKQPLKANIVVVRPSNGSYFGAQKGKILGEIRAYGECVLDVG